MVVRRMKGEGKGEEKSKNADNRMMGKVIES